MVIQHNNPAFISWRHGNGNKHKLARTLEKLSSGLRINRAADDAAGLAVSEKLRAQVTGLTQAHINSNNGISVVQTAEGALEEDHQILRRMTDLAVESANGIFTEGDRAKLDGEYQALLEELERISSSTNFNKIKLLDGSLQRRGCKLGQPAAGTALNAASMEPSAPLAMLAASNPIAGTDAHITADGVYEIQAGFTGTIIINAGLNVTLTQAGSAALSNVSIQCGGGVSLTANQLSITNNKDIHAINFTGSGNKLHLEGANRFISTAEATTDPVTSDFQEVKNAVIHVGAGAALTIDGSGSLHAETAGATADGQDCAVIGGDGEESAGSITMNSGTVTAISRLGGAAIGGGVNGDGGVITINGGTVEASVEAMWSQDCFSAAIGGGASGSAGQVTINGGTVSAKSLGRDHALGAAIGSGSGGEDGTVRINGGTVNAVSEHGGAAIGSGSMGECHVVISGGTVDAKNIANDAVPSGAAIGGGVGKSGQVTIEGGTVKAYAEGEGAAIGGGTYGDGENVITIKGGSVSASTGANASGAAIGGGSNSDGGTIGISGMAQVEVTVGNNAYGAAIGGGKGCFLAPGAGGAGDLNTPGKPGKGANLTIGGQSTVLIKKGWVGGGLDEHGLDFGVNGVTKVCTDSTLTLLDPDPPAVGISHFPTGSPGDPTAPPITFDPGDPVDPGVPDAKNDCAGGGLILQIGTDNAEYDRLHIYIDDMSVNGLGLEGSNIRTIDNAGRAVDVILVAIDRVSRNRGRLGAYQNRLEHNIAALASAAENIQAAESRLRDADMAKEMAAFTIQNVLTQAADAMLAQANQQPNALLSMLR